MLVAAVQVVMTFLTLLSPVFLQPAYAAAAGMGDATLYYKGDSQPTDTNVEDLNSAFASSMGIAESTGGFFNSNELAAARNTVLVLKGSAFGTTPFALDYNSGTAPSDGIPYTRAYNCYIDGSGKPVIADQGAEVKPQHWLIDLNVYVKKVASSVSDPHSLQAVEAIRSIKEYQAFVPGQNQAQIAEVDDSGNYLGVNLNDIHSVNLAGGGGSLCLPSNYLNNRPWHWSEIAASSAAPPNHITPGNNTSSGSNGLSDISACESEPSSSALGWILCPIITAATTTINLVVQEVIIPQLEIKPLTLGQGDDKNQYAIWNNFRLLANVFFLLAFMVIVFANTLQFNIETYAIKKMLPRLVAAVILVQFSYVISSIIIDIGNVLGNGIQAMVHVTAAANLQGTGKSGSIELLGGVIGAAFAVGVAAIIGIPTLVTIAIAGVIGAIGVLVTLIVRQLIIIILVVASPIAFALWVLPNTERMFKLWLDNFIKLVLMFPIIVLILSLASVAAAATQSSGNTFQKLLGALFPIIAFFMIPMTFKMAGSAMSFSSNAVGGLTKQGRGKATGAWKDSEANKALRARKAARKQSKLIQTLGTENGDHRVRRWAAGVRTRGDLLGGRSLEFNKGRPTLKGGRADVLQRQAKVQKDVLFAGLQKELREQYDNLSTDELIERLKDPNMSLAHVEAVAGVAAIRGAADQPQFLGALVNKYKNAPGGYDREAASKAVSRFRDLNYPSILKSAPTYTSFDILKGDDIDANNKVTFSAALAASTASKAGDKLGDQTGPGWGAIADAKMTRGEMEKLVRMPELATDVQKRIDTHLKATAGAVAGLSAADAAKVVYSEIQDAAGVKQTVGKAIISDAARKSILDTDQIKAKVMGTPAEKLIV